MAEDNQMQDGGKNMKTEIIRMIIWKRDFYRLSVVCYLAQRIAINGGHLEGMLPELAQTQTPDERDVH